MVPLTPSKLTDPDGGGGSSDVGEYVYKAKPLMNCSLHLKVAKPPDLPTMSNLLGGYVLFERLLNFLMRATGRIFTGGCRRNGGIPLDHQEQFFFGKKIERKRKNWEKNNESEKETSPSHEDIYSACSNPHFISQ